MSVYYYYYYYYYAHTLWRTTTKFDVVTYMGRGLVFSGSATPQPQRGASPALPSYGVPFYLCVHRLSQNYRIWRGNTYGKLLVLRGQSLPPQGGWVKAPPVFGVPFYFAYTLWRRTTKYDVVTRKGMVQGVRHAPTSRGCRVPALQILGSFLLLCTSPFAAEQPNLTC